MITADVRVFECQGKGEGREIRLTSPTDKIILSIQNFAAEVEREKATCMHVRRDAPAGARGTRDGRCRFRIRQRQGVRGGRATRSCPAAGYAAEAAVIARIYDMSAQGLGLRTIAVRLNDEHAVAPKPRRKERLRGWTASSGREILHRELYRGVIVWNRTRKRDAWGRKRQRPKDEWIRVSAPKLRIVSEEL